jgi:hypothetical protein
MFVLLFRLVSTDTELRFRYTCPPMALNFRLTFPDIDYSLIFHVYAARFLRSLRTCSHPVKHHLDKTLPALHKILPTEHNQISECSLFPFSHYRTSLF